MIPPNIQGKIYLCYGSICSKNTFFILNIIDGYPYKTTDIYMMCSDDIFNAINSSKLNSKLVVMKNIYTGLKNSNL